jgi:hypothetical protein
VAIRAIETTYKGYRFRSRLEARWAVFFDVLGVDWEYEKEGYDLGAAGWYLPDFWLPDLRMWAEVKAGAFTPEEQAKAKALADGTGFEVLRLPGMPTYTVYWATVPAGREYGDEADYILDDQYVHSERRWFGSPGLRDGEDASKTYDTGERTRAAYEAARGARFEHGELMARYGVKWSWQSQRVVVPLP